LYQYDTIRLCRQRPTIGMSGKDRAPRSCGDVDVELRRLTS